MFRRRRRDGENDTGLPPDDQDYPAADDELAEEDFDDAAFDDAFDETAEEGYGYADEEEAGSEAAGVEPGGQDEPSRGPRRDDLGDPATWTRLRDSQVMTPAMTRSDGPWDSASEYPDRERIDFGSLLIPARDGYDVQVFVSEEEGISIAVVSGDSGLQLQPFAAPRSSGLWHEVLPEIAEEVAKAGGQSQERSRPVRARAASDRRAAGGW